MISYTQALDNRSYDFHFINSQRIKSSRNQQKAFNSLNSSWKNGKEIFNQDGLEVRKYGKRYLAQDVSHGIKDVANRNAPIFAMFKNPSELANIKHEGQHFNIPKITEIISKYEKKRKLKTGATLALTTATGLGTLAYYKRKNAKHS